MSLSTLYLVVYDISNDKRRTKLHYRLLDYGTPVQYSVFECLLDPKTKVKMQKMVNKTIKPRKDSLRIYCICADCAEKAEIVGGREILKPDNEPIVV